MPSPDPRVLRLLDASRNRAAEGLRVVEDFARFVLDDPHLTALAKGIRHDLASTLAPLERLGLVACRDVAGDVGALIQTEAESRRDDAEHAAQAGLHRAQQALRALEEFGKTIDPAVGQRLGGLRYRVYALGKGLASTADATLRLAGVRLCVLVPGGESGEGLARLAESLCDAGVDMIQLRDKTLDGRRLVERARRLVAVCRPRRVLVVVNDRADVAAAAGADGVHVGQEDLAVRDARAIVGPRALVGVSTHAISQARAAALDGADYLGAGPIFPSGTKRFDVFPGVGYLREVAREVRLPTLAIGGIDASNLPEVIAAGIGRVAVSSAVVDAADPAAAARRLRGLLGGPPDRTSHSTA